MESDSTSSSSSSSSSDEWAPDEQRNSAEKGTEDIPPFRSLTDAPPPKKRPAVNRYSSQTDTLDREEKRRMEEWLSELSTLTEPKLRRQDCCKSLRCFLHVDYNYFLLKAKEILSETGYNRGKILYSMLSSEDSFIFNGRKVCSRFLTKAFHFSFYLISSTIKRRRQESTSSSAAGTVETNAPNGSSSGVYFVPCEKRESIMSFFIRLCRACGDQMPDRDEVHLPFNRKKDVYQHFLNERQLLNDSKYVPTKSYFLRVWK